MGLLDSVIGAIGAQVGAQVGAPGGAQGGAPHGGQNELLSAVIGMINNQPGGLSGLVQKFQQGGLGDIVASWVGTGQNLPITPAQLGQVLGTDVLGGLMARLGGGAGGAANPADALGPLAQLLPQVVDKLTPNGHVPQGAEAGGLGDLGSLLGGLMGGGTNR